MATIFVEMCQGLGLHLILFTETFTYKSYEVYFLNNDYKFKSKPSLNNKTFSV